MNPSNVIQEVLVLGIVAARGADRWWERQIVMTGL